MVAGWWQQGTGLGFGMAQAPGSRCPINVDFLRVQHTESIGNFPPQPALKHAFISTFICV